VDHHLQLFRGPSGQRATVSDNNISAEDPSSNKRKRRYIKKVRHQGSRAYEEADLPQDKAFIRELRWHYLFKFRIAEIEGVIEKVYKTTDQDSFTWSEAYQIAQSKFRN
jgi:hypothetical protein